MFDLMEDLFADNGYDYETVWTDLVTQTDGFTKDSGIFQCKDKTAAIIAENILAERYSDVEIRDLDFTKDYDLVYRVLYSSRRVDESKKDDLDYKMLAKPNPSGALMNKGTGGSGGEGAGAAGGGMGESMNINCWSNLLENYWDCEDCFSKEELIEIGNSIADNLNAELKEIYFTNGLFEIIVCNEDCEAYFSMSVPKRLWYDPAKVSNYVSAAAEESLCAELEGCK